MHVKKDDNIIVIAGKDKGKSGKIIRAFPAKDLVLVEGINIRKKHQKANRQGGKGAIVEHPFPIHVSNVRLASAPTKAKTKPAAKKAEKPAAKAEKAAKPGAK